MPTLDQGDRQTLTEIVATLDAVHRLLCDVVLHLHELLAALQPVPDVQRDRQLDAPGNAEAGAVSTRSS